MQQSTAQIKLDNKANYNRLFRSIYRLIDYQLKQQYNQQQCIYCRRSKKQFQITYLEFPSEKQTIKELNDLIQQKVLQLLSTRFTYIAIALSSDLMTTKRWTQFYKNLSKHKEVNQTLLIKKLNTIIQVYGLHAHVQQIQTLITKFLDTNRYETDVIETEQVNIYRLGRISKQEYQYFIQRDESGEHATLPEIDFALPEFIVLAFAFLKISSCPLWRKNLDKTLRDMTLVYARFFSETEKTSQRVQTLYSCFHVSAISQVS
jgi:hypothetical protein